jgi:hypothetical protein
MRDTKNQRMARLYAGLSKLGFSYDESATLIKIERTLQRWSERECGDGNEHGSWAIERDETSEKPFLVHHRYLHGRGKDTVTRTAIADREKGALARLAKIMAAHPELVSYHQTDPRGCALHILRRSDIREVEDIGSIYTRGLAVCV